MYNWYILCLFACYLLNIYIPFKNFSLIWRRHHCRWSAANSRPMLGAQGLWAGRDLYHAIPAVTQSLGFSGLIRRTTSLVASYDTRGCGGSILTRILTFPHSVTSYNTQDDAEDLFLSASSQVKHSVWWSFVSAQTEFYLKQIEFYVCTVLPWQIMFYEERWSFMSTDWVLCEQTEFYKAHMAQWLERRCKNLVILESLVRIPLLDVGAGPSNEII
jgi:hypothetical protein